MQLSNSGLATGTTTKAVSTDLGTSTKAEYGVAEYRPGAGSAVSCWCAAGAAIPAECVRREEGSEVRLAVTAKLVTRETATVAIISGFIISFF